MSAAEQTLRETFIATAAPVICEWLIENAQVPDHWKRDPDTWRFIQHRDTPDGREYAAQLYGMVIALNGPLSGVVAAAREKWDREHVGQYTDDHKFFRAIAVESLGGAKVSETFGEIRVRRRHPDCTRDGCGCGAPIAFTVPRLIIEREVS